MLKITPGKFKRENNIKFTYKKMNRKNPNIKNGHIKPLKLLKNAKTMCE
jgi:hypothetical protein